MSHSSQEKNNVEITPYLLNAAVVLLVALAFPLASAFPPMGELIRWLDGFSYRWQIRSASMPETSKVRIIDFDQATFAETGARASPLDRNFLGSVLDQVAHARPAVIVVDIDLRHRLRPVFEQNIGQFPIANTWLDALDSADNRLIQIVNRIVADGTPVVLGMPAETPPLATPMAFATTNAALYFGLATAWVRSVDRVIYGLPTMLAAEEANGAMVGKSAQPSLALAAWAAYQGLPSSVLLSGAIPPEFDKEKLSLWQTLSGGEELFMNWYRLDPDGQTALIPQFSAVAVMRSDKATAPLAGKVVVVGRSHFVSEPIQERQDTYSTPFPGVKIQGMNLHALFIDNLLNRSWLSKPSWWLALAVGCGLSILLGSVLLWMGMNVEAISTWGYWGKWLLDPLLSFAISLALSLAVALLVNLMFLENGMYMASLALIPLSGFMEAMLYNAWTLRS